MTKNLQNTLRTTFGIETFRDKQQEVVECVIQKKSCIAIMATGSGKSLCYQISGIHLEHLVIVVSPLLSLIDDQLKYLRSINVSAEKIDSSQDLLEKNRIEGLLLTNQVKFLFLSVERFENERFTNLLGKLKVSLLVIDEAHCISQWGHNFRPAYLNLRSVQKKYKIKSTLLLTATATNSVVRNMQKIYRIKDDCVFNSTIYRNNLHISIKMYQGHERLIELISLLRECGPTIIYVNKQEEAKNLSFQLSQNSIENEYFHGGLDSKDKGQIQQNFMDGSTNILIATIAFGMGINKKNIRQVIHWGFPSSIESYYQEIGRAGRDKGPSNCTLLSSFNEACVQKNFIDAGLPSYEQCEKLIEIIQNSYSSYLDINYYELSNILDLNGAILKTMFFYLEQMKVLETMYKYHQFFEYKYLTDIDEIHQFLNPTELEVFQQIQVHETINYYRYTTDLSKLHIDGFSRENIENVLSKLDDYAFIKLFKRRSKTMYKIKGFSFNLHVKCDELYKLLLKGYKRKDKKLSQLLSFLKKDVCYWTQLCTYFGEDALPDCGYCTNCKSSSKIIPKQILTSLNQFELKDVMIEFLDIVESERVNPHFIARYLCGFSSPLIYKYQLHKTPDYGKFSEYGFDKLYNWVNKFYADLER